MTAAPFSVRDCALVAIATGLRAQSLREFRDALLQAPQESVYYHFWGRLLRPRFDDTEFHNDFATWAAIQAAGPGSGERSSAVLDPFGIQGPGIPAGGDRRRSSRIISPTSRSSPGHLTRSRFISCTRGLPRSRPGLEGPDPDGIPRDPRLRDASVIYYHTFEAILRLGRSKGDFAIWIEQQLELPDLAEKLAHGPLL